MARTALTVITPKGPHPGTVAAEDLDISFTAGDAVNGNSFPHTGKELLLVRNVHGTTAQTFTIDSVDDPYKRQSDIEAYSLGFGEYAAFWMGAVTGWRQTDGNVYLDVSTADIQFAVVRIP